MADLARGVGELNYEGGHGKFGAIVGDPVVSNVTKALKKSRGYPVQYPASSNVIADTRQGAHDIVGRLMAQAANCPDQTFSLVGYSQGAGVIHAAADEIPRNLYPRIKSLVLFGDGFQLKGKDLSSFPDGLDEKVLQVCARDDPVSPPPTMICGGLNANFLLGMQPSWILHILPSHIQPTRIHRSRCQVHCCEI